MKFGSLFTGIGGMDLGLERAGLECAWQVEIDEFCRRVLARHWPSVARYGDIKEVGADLAPVDVIAGGPPCQPVSLAGKRMGQDDERWLWPEMFRVVSLIRPKWVIVENVPGLRTKGLGLVRRDLDRIGYRSGAFRTTACAFGAPHARERVFTVAHSEGAHEPQPRLQPPAVPLQPRGSSGPATWTTDWWLSEPDVDRVVDGPPSRLDIGKRLSRLGNAVVPQVAEYIGRRLMACS